MSNKDMLGAFADQEDLRKAPALFDAMLGKPVWWVSGVPNGTSWPRRGSEMSFRIWKDTRVRALSKNGRWLKGLRRSKNSMEPKLIREPNNAWTWVLPLAQSGKVVGLLAVSGRTDRLGENDLKPLASYLKLLWDHTAKTEELNRISATIRPRAVALSTVHTVHRIINSTLNLNELISRLAHLTAQVLRVHRCSIYLIDKKSKPISLECKALVGYSKGRQVGMRLRVGRGVEGRVAKYADIVLHKKFICAPLIDEDVTGVVTVAMKKDSSPFNYFDLEILTTLAEEAVIAIKNAQMYEEQKKVTLGTIQSLAVILGARTSSASLPPEVFLNLAMKVADEIHMGEEDKQALHYATLLKETARVGIPDEILKKSSKLTREELNLLREHPIHGARIVQNFESLKSVAPIILYSREKYDGSGYPEGLKGDAIPVGARILSVLNAFEAIIVGRPYRGQSSVREALEEIGRNSGSQFDPKIVEPFIVIVKKAGTEAFRRP